MNATLTHFLSSFMSAQVATALIAVLCLVLADFLFGVFTSLRAGTFVFSKLPQFMETSLVPYIGGLLVLAFFSSINTELSVLFFGIAATVTAKFIADITVKVGQLFSGVELHSPITVNSAAPAAPATEAAPAKENTPAQ